jgi:Carboxypeptidase regulatory-like domain/TonB dependent receptor
MKGRIRVGLLLVIALGAGAFAQTTNATLGGTVSDASRALIPGVTVTATNTQTGIVSMGVTNETGSYNFPSLQSGTYKVSAELPGFQTQIYNDVSLGVSQQVRLNFALQVSGQSQSVEVNVAADTLIATTSSSVGSVLPEYKVRDLPLATRNVLDLVGTAAGTQGSNFAGGRLTQLNTTRDGIPISDGRYEIGASTSTYVSPDLVDEVRVIVAPADAETGRGSGQIQMSTRSGTNEFRGSLFWVNRNSKLSANSWNNNFQGVGKDYYNGNQYGGRVGGPIIRNKTFFFFLFDGQRYVTKSSFTGTVLTDQARQGIFRYFPGAQNGNALTNTPTVDRAGNPLKPASATGDLTSFNVFGREVNGVFTPWDVNRTGFDSSGWVKTLLGRMPSPNDYTIGDGLNTAGIRWLRRVEGQDTTNGNGDDTSRDQYNMRIDHNVNTRHKAFFSGTWERDAAVTVQAGISNWPGGYDGIVRRAPRVITGSLVSTLSPTIVNEFRVGTRKNWHYSWASFLRPDAVGEEARKAIPTRNSVPFIPQHALLLNNIITGFGGPSTRGQQSPLFNYSDTLAWTKGKHAFRAGFEARFTSSAGFNGSDNKDWYQYPLVTVSSPSVPVTGIATIAGLVGANVTTAQNLLLDLAGAVSGASLSNGFNVRSAQQQSFEPINRYKEFHQKEWGAFFKDDWKIRPDLTFNVGIRYDFYGVPWETSGLHPVPVDGAAGLFGISGTSFNDMWQPGRTAGKPTVLQLVGKNSDHPDLLPYKNDRNNFAPAVGLSWSLPWGPKDKTVLRAGYGVSYQGAASFNEGLSLFTGNNPGLSYAQNFVTLGIGNQAFTFSSPNLPVPLPAPTNVKPLSVEPFDVRTNSLSGFDDNRVNPYIQNYNLEIQRELAKNLTLEARYIGSKGTHLYGRISLNETNIYENGILNAFNVTQQGGNAVLFDQILNGITLNAGTNASLGQGVVNGTTLTGSAALRANTIFKTFLANGNVGQFASALNASTTVTGRAGGLLARNGFPDNFIVVNPQYASVAIAGNPSSSTYHAMTLQVTKRLSQGFTQQFAYTWSRTLSDIGAGDNSTEYLDLRNRQLNHTLQAFHRTQDVRTNGTFELPFGPGRKFLANAPDFVSRIVERWQFGTIFSWSSGPPITITASNAELSWSQAPQTINLTRTPNTPNILGAFPKDIGKLTYTSNGGYYFSGYTQVTDPSINDVTSLQTLQNSFSNKAFADANGNIVLANPAPGIVGTLGRQWIEGPAHANLDVNLVKRIRLAERKEFEMRVDVVNIMNNPRWSLVSSDINSTNFGILTAADPANRRFTFSTRLNF